MLFKNLLQVGKAIILCASSVSALVNASEYNLGKGGGA